MSRLSQDDQAVPPEEVERRIAEYRCMGFERQAMPPVVYEEPYVACPWPGCGFRIAAMDFHLEKWDPAHYAQWLKAWWQGAGLVRRCPGCNHFVLFSYKDKRMVQDPAIYGSTVLSDDWQRKAHII